MQFVSHSVCRSIECGGAQSWHGRCDGSPAVVAAVARAIRAPDLIIDEDTLMVTYCGSDEEES